MYNATLYFKRQLDKALDRAAITESQEEFVELVYEIRYLRTAIYALERLEEQDADK